MLVRESVVVRACVIELDWCCADDDVGEQTHWISCSLLKKNTVLAELFCKRDLYIYVFIWNARLWGRYGVVSMIRVTQSLLLFFLQSSFAKETWYLRESCSHCQLQLLQEFFVLSFPQAIPHACLHKLPFPPPPEFREEMEKNCIPMLFLYSKCVTRADSLTCFEKWNFFWGIRISGFSRSLWRTCFFLSWDCFRNLSHKVVSILATATVCHICIYIYIYLHAYI